MSNNQLQTIDHAPAVALETLQSIAGMDVQTLGRVLAQSGYFRDASDPAKAIVKVLYGAEIGVGPVSSMMSIHIIEGKPAPSANLVASLVKRSGRYNYRVIRMDNDGCELLFTDRGEEMGPSSFTSEDAQRAGLLNRKGPWQTYPKAMYFARAVTMGARTYCPDVFGGAPVYSPEELGAEVDEDGNPISAAKSTPQQFTPQAAPSPQAEPEPEPIASPHDLKLYKEARESAMELGYKTPNNNDPKVLQPGVSAAECDRRTTALLDFVMEKTQDEHVIDAPEAAEAEVVTV